MNADKLVPWMKWGLCALAVGIGGYWLLPILKSMVIDAVTIGVLAVAGIGLWIFMPAFFEMVAMFSAKLMHSVWAADPITRLRRDLIAHQDQIDTMEKEIARANASVLSLETMLTSKRSILRNDVLRERLMELEQLKAFGASLVVMRNEEIEKHRDFAMQIQAKEAELGVAVAFKSAMKAFTFAKRQGPKSLGSQVALDSIRDQLSESKSRIQLVLNRPDAMPALGQQGDR